MNPVRIGMLGLGQRGLQHLRAVYQLQQAGLARLVTLADAFPTNVDPQKLQKFVPGLPTDEIQLTTNLETLFDGSLDALYISIPPNVHQGEIVRAAAAGIHLFIEKPMSLYLDEALEMERAISAAGILSTVGFQQRFDARHEAIKAFLQDKPLVMASYTRHDALEAHSVKHTPTEAVGGPGNRVWTASRAWSGGTVVEAGIHPLDVWRYWFGDVEWVQSVYNHRSAAEIIDGADNPYAYNVLFGFQNGVVGNLILSRLRRVFSPYQEQQILWNEGRLALEDDAVVIHAYHGPYPPSSQPTTAEVQRILPVGPAQDTTLAISRAFVEAVAHNDPTRIRSPFPDAMNSLAAVLAANISDELQGQRVNLHELLTSPAYAHFRQKPSAAHR
ncbi:MAG: Gfo/Idh/MocA family oxidoreductase [Caldilineaceae bacterium]|nr:Gfo/Idh/MocA family oxidoreductase [Caldilineaceae bacterium]